MIGYLLAQLRTLVLEPQATVPDVERRAFLDPDAQPLNVNAQELDLMALSTTVLSTEIGGGLALRHVVSVALSVEHGDAAEAMRLRDAVTLDLVLRFLAARPALLAEVDPDSGQYGTEATIAVSYLPLEAPPDVLAEFATLTITLDTQLDA